MSFLHLSKKIGFYCIVLLIVGCVSTDNTANKKDTSSSTTTKSASTETPQLENVKEKLASASKDEVSEAIGTAEKELYGSDNNNLEFDKSKAQKLVDTYQVFTTKFPEDTSTANYLFKSAEVLRSLRKFNEAVGIYGTIVKDHDDFEKAPHSLFLQGFTYENDLKNNEEAKKCYESFVEKYPKHELADDVQFSLDNLGKSPEDIIKEFEKKRKENEGK